MKNMYIFFSVVFVLLLECGPTKPAINYEDFFPLKIGNKWFYNSNYTDTSSIDQIWEVTGQSKINEKNYFEIIKRYTNSSDTSYYRTDGAKLFTIGIYDSEEIIADFSLGLNEKAYWNNGLIVAQKNDNSITFEIPPSGDMFYSITYQRGIGITSSVEDGFILWVLTLKKFEPAP